MGWSRVLGAGTRTLAVVIVLLAGSAFPVGRAAGGQAAADGEVVLEPPAPDAAPAEPLGDVPLSEDLGQPIYPSSGGPSPMGREYDEVPDFANVVSNHHFDDAYALGYDGSGVQVAVVDEGVDFGHIDLRGTQAVVTNASSPYYGWPIVYDQQSLTTYLETGYPTGTWYANTTQVGDGTQPFDVRHTVFIDGTNDFGDREKWGTDPTDQAAADEGGVKADYDLRDLYVTRDESFWYFGFNTYLMDRNVSFLLLVDVDNTTSGAYVSPRNIPVDVNASHSKKVNDLAWSPDGMKLATVSSDRRVRIWDRNGALLRTMTGHAGEPNSVAWTPDGTKVISADKNRFRVWEAATGAPLKDVAYVVPPEQPLTDETRTLSVSPNGTWVALSLYKYVHFFDVNTGVKFGTMTVGNTNVNAVAFSQDGQRIAVGLGNNTAIVYDVQTWPPTSRGWFGGAQGHTQPVRDVSWSPDGTRMVTVAQDNSVKLWDTTAPTAPLRTMSNHGSWVNSSKWSPDGTRFVTASRGLMPSTLPSFIIWDGAGNPICRVNLTSGWGFQGVTWSVLDEIATASSDLTARSWTPACSPIRTFVAQRPDYALYLHGFSRWEDRESKYVHGADKANWTAWNDTAGSWGPEIVLNDTGGRQAGFQFGEAFFNEFAVPRAFLEGDPQGIAVALFSTHENGSRAQDGVPFDQGFKNLDFSPGWNTIGAWAYRRIQQYRIQGLTSLSSAFHFGFHPGPRVQREYGALGLIVVDTVASGTYDTVVLDMNDDKVFDSTDVALTKANPIAAIDNFNASSGGPGQDGYPDVSAGMIYFISDDTTPIPYSERLYEHLLAEGNAEAKMRIPAAGNVVAFAGEFGIDAVTTLSKIHGTQLAGMLVAQGHLPTSYEGLAKNVKLIGIMNGLSDPVEAWTFAVEGYDGIPGTGDEADIVLSGFNYPTIHYDGWDVYSRTADYLSTQASQGRTTFIVSAGDNGFGYGTVASPASGTSVIAAGSAGDYSAYSSVFGGPEAANPHMMDPAMRSGRGPSTQGFVKPELLAVDYSRVLTPLLEASEGSSAVAGAPLVGSDVSATVVAGAAALTYEAFRSSYGRSPTVDEVRAILMSGADDAGHDVLTQGAGFLNVSRSVKLAAQESDAGLELQPPAWHPGAYRGQRYAGFTRLLATGDTESTTFSVYNRGTAGITANVETAVYSYLGRYEQTNATVRDGGSPPNPPYQPKGNIAFWVNDTGLWKVDPVSLVPVQFVAADPTFWPNADLIKVTATSNLSLLVSHPSNTSYLTNYTYTLRAYDWTIDWANWFGMTPFPWVEPPVPLAPELNTLAESFHLSNVLEVRTAFPATRLHDGLVISLETNDEYQFVDGLNWTFTVEFYQRVPWSWITVPASVTVPAGGSAPLAATIAVPPGTPLGSYEGAIRVEDPAHGLTTIPVLVNVAAMTPLFSFGGSTTSTDLYDNHRLFGGYDRDMATSVRLRRPTLGDWRFFFFEVADQGAFDNPVGIRLMVRTWWPDAPSDVDIFAFGNAGADVASKASSAWYGEFSLRQLQKSDELDKPDFKTITNGPEDIISYELKPGLNVIALRAFSLRGLEIDVRFAGKGGWVSTPTAVNVYTQDLFGKEPLSFMSNMGFPALRASAVGPATTKKYDEVEVNQDVASWWNFADWAEWMGRASFTYVVKVEKTAIFEVHIIGKSDVNDLDMAVFRDPDPDACYPDPNAEDPITKVKGDYYGGTGCKLEPPEYLGAFAGSCGGTCNRPIGGGDVRAGYDADGDADEKVIWTNPDDGWYYIKVLGFVVPSRRGHFDLEISLTLKTGKGYWIWEAMPWTPPPEIVNGTGSGLDPLTRVEVNLTWDLPPANTTDGAYGGGVLFGLPNAPGVIVVPVVIQIDRMPPTITTLQVTPLGGRLNVMDNRTTNDRAPQLAIALEDLEWGQLERSTVRFRLDGADITPLVDISIPYTTRGTKTALFQGTIAYTPSDLPDGTHTINVSIADFAGNAAYKDFTFVIDGAAPALVLQGASTVYTTANTFTVQGSTEPNAWVNVRGTWYPVPTGGTFSVLVDLLEGENALAVTATDWFAMDPSGNLNPGNAATVVQTVVLDVRPPEIDTLIVPNTLTREATAPVSGTVRDPVTAIQTGDPTLLTLEVAGVAVPVLADGSFAADVPLVEGDNAIDVVVTDPAGNQRTRSVSVRRDSTPPTLTIFPTPPTSTQSARVQIQGTAEASTVVTVNGIVVSTTGGAFSAPVDLNGGLNTIVVQAVDRAGNVQEERFEITRVMQPVSNLPLYLGLLVAGIAAGLIVAFLLVRAGVRIPGLSRGRGPEEAPPEAPPEEEVAEAVVEEEAPPEVEEAEEAEVEEAEVEDPQVARLRKAYEDGRISKEVYEQNLERLRKKGG